MFEKLFGEIFHNERVVARFAEKGSDPFEGIQEAAKIRVRVAAQDFIFRVVDAVAGVELRDDGGADAAFEMKMQLRFGERKNVFGKGRIVHGGMD